MGWWAGVLGFGFFTVPIKLFKTKVVLAYVILILIIACFFLITKSPLNTEKPMGTTFVLVQTKLETCGVIIIDLLP